MRSLVLISILLTGATISAIAEKKPSKWVAPHENHYSGDYVQSDDNEGQGSTTIHVRGYASPGDVFYLWACFIDSVGLAEHPNLKVLGQMIVDLEGASAKAGDNSLSFVIYADGSKGLIHDGRNYKLSRQQEANQLDATSE